jgi:CubicO group peptidase (beta-lactamase class C family)
MSMDYGRSLLECDSTRLGSNRNACVNRDSGPDANAIRLIWAACFWPGLLSVCFLLIGFHSVFSFADDEPVVKEIDEIRKDTGTPGLTYATVRNGQVVLSGATGLRKMGSESPILVGDKMHLGSCTKAMTAALVATLVEEEKLTWNATLGELFPEQREQMHEDYRVVTLDLVLRHRGGLPANLNWSRLEGKTDTEKRWDVLRRVTSKPPIGPPGESYLYSNVGYAIAGLVAENITGKPWQELMGTRIFEPLKMDSAGFGIPGKKNTVDQPWGHRKVLFFRETPSQTDNPSPLGPAGTVHATVEDWGKFATIFTDKGRKDNPILTTGQIEHLTTLSEPTHDYALGWLVDEKAEQAVELAHSGSNTLWYCTVRVIPGRNLVLLVATNSGTAGAKSCQRVIAAQLKAASAGVR